MIVKTYMLMKKLLDLISYSFSRSLEKKIVVLTFDDHVDSNNIEIPKFLESKNIRATFFLTLKQTEPSIIEQLVNMGHEIGGHSLMHDEQEKSGNYETAHECYDILKKYDNHIVSWRFPWTSKNNKALENVRNAGFILDSSKGTFYPVKKLEKLGKLFEIPWLRLPKTWQMDINEKDYNVFKKYIIDMITKKSGVFVLGFHTYYQYDHISKFKEFIDDLEKTSVTFMTLRESFNMLNINKEK